MGLFDRLFRRQTSKKNEPNTQFGRYSDSYKPEEKHEFWDKALTAFEQEDYKTTYEFFFTYLADDFLQNVTFRSEATQLHFSFFQGSKQITGYTDEQSFKAEAKVAKANHQHVSFMRRLLERNFDLEYSRFAIDTNDHICIIFDTHHLNASPYKLYYALKELAIHADKQDDILLAEFDMLTPINTSHIIDTSAEEKECKYQFAIQSIKQTLALIDDGSLPVEQKGSSSIYLLLALCYKLDYLLSPEGVMMETLERIHRTYFANDAKNALQKSLVLRKEFEQLAQRPKEAFFKEFYMTTATFGITTPVNHEKMAGFMEAELKNTTWYLENGYLECAEAICTYIVGYALFNWAPPQPDREFLHLYFEIMEPNFFASLGFTNQFNNASVLQKKAIKQEIQNIVATNKKQYPELRANTALLQFTDRASFAVSYLNMIKELNTSNIR